MLSLSLSLCTVLKLGSAAGDCVECLNAGKDGNGGELLVVLAVIIIAILSSVSCPRHSVIVVVVFPCLFVTNIYFGSRWEEVALFFVNLFFCPVYWLVKE